MPSSTNDSIIVTTSSVGLANMLCVMVTPLLQPLIGALLSLSPHHHHSYTSGDYRLALSVLPALLLVAAVVAWWIPDLTVQTDESST